MVSWKTILLAFGITTIDVGMLELASAIGGSGERGIIFRIPYFVLFLIELEEFFDNEEEMNMKRPLVPEIIISIPTLKIGSVSSPYFSKNNFWRDSQGVKLCPCSDKWLCQANYYAYCQGVVSLQPYLPWCLH
ncbi:hypothetical protein AMTRI_Chr05g57280 [Amborella trichopoda]